jgi:GNAT superfamily N-acetyltransferase
MLNEAWIREHFTLEPADHLVLHDPEKHIIRPGGRIFMAVADDVPIGCCALLSKAGGVYELGKLTVAPSFRGRGIGRRILEHAIRQARRMSAKSMFLGSNTALRDAIHLYESVGFRAVTAEDAHQSPYVRTDIHMALSLEPATDNQ